MRQHSRSNPRSKAARRWPVYAVGLLFMLMALGWLAFRQGWFADRTVQPEYVVRIGEHAFQAELVLDPETRARGMSGRANVPADTGMLFAYDEPQPPGRVSAYWMKGCLVDLDIAFISPDMRIVTVATMKAQPDAAERDLILYAASHPYQFTLELRAGELARRGISVGDRVEFSPDVAAAVRGAR